VREGPIPKAEVRAADFGFARQDWFDEALRLLEQGPLFLAGRAGTGRRGPCCGRWTASNMDRWQPTDASARGYLMDGLFPSRPLGPGVLGHVRELLQGVRARMVIVLPDETDLLRRHEHDLHVTPIMCVPPPPDMVFGNYFEAVVEDRWERKRLLSALQGSHDLGDLLAPELVPADVVELVTAIVAADGDPEALGDLEARLGYRAEQEVPISWRGCAVIRTPWRSCWPPASSKGWTTGSFGRSRQAADVVAGPSGRDAARNGCRRGREDRTLQRGLRFPAVHDRIAACRPRGPAEAPDPHGGAYAQSVEAIAFVGNGRRRPYSGMCGASTDDCRSCSSSGCGR
jgi:hypothetical protein